MYLVQRQGARRAPFSDWLAQVDRIAAKHQLTVVHMTRNPFVRAMYDVGLQPGEAFRSISEDSR